MAERIAQAVSGTRLLRFELTKRGETKKCDAVLRTVGPIGVRTSEKLKCNASKVTRI
jgi:hypothetical protein